MYKNMCNTMLPDIIPEVYEFTTTCDITIGDTTVTKYVTFGTDINTHNARCKYYYYHEIHDGEHIKCRNMGAL
jgi:hypothetical protein